MLNLNFPESKSIYIKEVPLHAYPVLVFCPEHLLATAKSCGARKIVLLVGYLSLRWTEDYPSSVVLVL